MDNRTTTDSNSLVTFGLLGICHCLDLIFFNNTSIFALLWYYDETRTQEAVIMKRKSGLAVDMKV